MLSQKLALMQVVLCVILLASALEQKKWMLACAWFVASGGWLCYLREIT